MSSLNDGGKATALALSNGTAGREIVRIPESYFSNEQLDLSGTPTIVWYTPLGEKLIHLTGNRVPRRSALSKVGC
jgi:hypothetical protein